MDKEKVVKGLEYCAASCKGAWEDNNGCPYMSEFCKKCLNDNEYNGRCIDLLCADALALLKAQEPRVMTWEEVKAWHKTGISEREPIFVEYRPEPSFGPSRWWLDDFGIAEVDDEAMVCYNKYFRWWTSRPTDAQREAIPWN